MIEPAVELEQITRVYQQGRGRAERVALNGISLSINDGAWIALLGPNGSGKSTLLRILGTLDHPTSGRIAWFGDPELTTPSTRGRLGVVFQTPALDRLLTIRENLRLQGELFNLAVNDIQARTNELATELGLSDRLDDRVATLSGGFARRTDLARAFITHPSLLLLDEPTAGLDPTSRDHFMAALQRRHAAGGLTIVMSTHLIPEAERAQRIIMLHEGAVVADGSAAELQNEVAGGDALILRAPSASESILHAMSLSPRISGDEALTLAPRHNNDQITGAVRALLDAGYPMSIGPATLGDVYEAKTGQTLSQPESA